MTTSLLTTRRDAIFTQMLAKLADAGYAYDPLTTSLDKYLATALAGLAGGTNLYKTRGRSRLLADLVTALGGSGNVLTQSELALVAEIVDASGGGPAPYQGPLDIVSGAVVAYSQRAMAAANRGSALYTMERFSDSVTQVFNSDATTGEAPDSDIIAFLGPSVALSGTIADGGSGYDDGNTPSTFDVTVVGGTHTTAAVFNVSTDGTGVVTTINSVTTAGSYTVTPSNPVATTGDDGVNHGTGLTLTVSYGTGGFSVWNDQSGNGYNQTPDIDVWRWATKSGSSSHGFGNIHSQSGSNAVVPWTAAAPATIIIVANIDAGDAGKWPSISLTPAVGAFFEIFGGAPDFDLANAGGDYTQWNPDAGSASGVHIYAVQVAANGTAVMSIDGVDQNAAITDGLLQALSAITDSQVLMITPGSSSIVYEAAIWPTAMSNPNFASVLQNIADFYGITLS